MIYWSKNVPIYLLLSIQYLTFKKKINTDETDFRNIFEKVDVTNVVQITKKN